MPCPKWACLLRAKLSPQNPNPDALNPQTPPGLIAKSAATRPSVVQWLRHDMALVYFGVEEVLWGLGWFRGLKGAQFWALSWALGQHIPVTNP